MFKTLLVPLDGSALAETALAVACTIAKPSKAKIDLLLVHQPVPFAGFTDAPWSSERMQAEEKYLEAAADAMRKCAAGLITHKLIRGNVIETIGDRAAETQADLVIMTSHGRTGFSRLWFGSVADGVLRHSKAAVLVLPLAENKDKRRVIKPFRHILVTLDGSMIGDTILPAAADLARATNAQVTLLTIVQPVRMLIPESVGTFASSAEIPDESATRYVVGEATRQLAEHAKALGEEGIKKVRTKVIVAEHVAHTILAFASDERVDAVAMSTHGRGASRLVMGSIADKIIRASRLPALVQRPAGVKTTESFLNTAEADLEFPSLTVY